MEEPSHNETTSTSNIEEDYDGNISLELLESMEEELLDDIEIYNKILRDDNQLSTIEHQQQEQQQEIIKHKINNQEQEKISLSTNSIDNNYSGFIEAVRQAKKRKNLAHDLESFQMFFSCLSESIQKQHDLTLNEWWNYYLFENKDPLETNLSVFIGYLEKKLDAGSSTDDLKSISSTICLVSSDKMANQIHSLSFLFSEFAKYLSLHIETNKHDELNTTSLQVENVDENKSIEQSDILMPHDDQLDIESSSSTIDLSSDSKSTNHREHRVSLQEAIDSLQLIAPMMNLVTPTTVPPAIPLYKTTKKTNCLSTSVASNIPATSNLIHDKSPPLPSCQLNTNEEFEQNKKETIDSVSSFEKKQDKLLLHSKNIIDNPETTIVQHQIEGNIVKMLVIIPNSDKKLITFDISNEECTVSDLLAYAGISINEIKSVIHVKNSLLKINYIVECKNYMVIDSIVTSNGNDDNRLFNKKNLQDVFNDDNQQAISTEQSKYIDKKYVICSNCGLPSIDFNYCYICEKKIKKNPTIISKIDKSTKKKNTMSTEKFNENLLNNNIDNIQPKLNLHTEFMCLTVMIGSYKYVPKDYIIINTTGLTLSVPLFEDETETVKIHIKYQDIVKVLVHFGKSTPVLFFYTNTISCSKIREILGMQDTKEPYYDPASEIEIYKKITLLPKSLNDETKIILIKLFLSNNLLQELTTRQTNTLLRKSSQINTNDSICKSKRIKKRHKTVDDDSAEEIKASKHRKLSSDNQDDNVKKYRQAIYGNNDYTGDKSYKTNSDNK